MAPGAASAPPSTGGGSETDESGAVGGVARAAERNAAATRLDFRLKKHTRATLRSSPCSGVSKRRPGDDQMPRHRAPSTPTAPRTSTPFPSGPASGLGDRGSDSFHVKPVAARTAGTPGKAGPQEFVLNAPGEHAVLARSRSHCAICGRRPPPRGVSRETQPHVAVSRRARSRRLAPAATAATWPTHARTTAQFSAAGDTWTSSGRLRRPRRADLYVRRTGPGRARRQHPACGRPAGARPRHRVAPRPRTPAEPPATRMARTLQETAPPHLARSGPCTGTARSLTQRNGTAALGDRPVPRETSAARTRTTSRALPGRRSSSRRPRP